MRYTFCVRCGKNDGWEGRVSCDDRPLPAVERRLDEGKSYSDGIPNEEDTKQPLASSTRRARKERYLL